MPTIQKRKDSYKITVSCGYDIHGKQKRETTTYKPKATTPKAIEKEVKAFSIEFEKKVKSGKLFEGETITFYEVAQQWLNSYAIPNLSKGNVESMIYHLNKWVYGSIGNMKISSIKAIHFQNIIDDMNRQGYAPNTIRLVYASISSIMTYAYRMEIIDNNPLKRCKLPSIRKNNDLHYFTLEQARAFLNALDMKYPFMYKEHKSKNGITKKEQSIKEYTVYKSIPLQFKVLFYLAIYGGFRVGEIVALTWNDIDFDNNTINIRHNTGRLKGGQYIKEPKTETSKRVIVLPQSCFTLLEQWYQEQKNLASSLGTTWQGKHGKMYNNSFIFIQSNGKQMNINTPYHKFKEIISNYNALVEDESKKLPDIRFHDLRHTTATLLLSENVDIETVSHRLGHSKTSVTLDIYGHALKSKDITASNKLESLFENTALNGGNENEQRNIYKIHQ